MVTRARTSLDSRLSEPPESSPTVVIVFNRREIITIGLTIALCILAGILTNTGGNAIVTFVANAAALSMLATMVGAATEEIGSRLPPGPTGVLQSALGSMPELFVCIFSLRAGLVKVVQAALIGSILANLLLVLGLAILVGGIKHGRQRFDSEAPRMIASLMMLAVTALAIPTLAFELHTAASTHEEALSAACAVLLLIVFAASIPFALKSDPERSPRHKSIQVDEPANQPALAAEPTRAGWPLWLAVAVLTVAAIGAAFVSEWFVQGLEPAIHAIGFSEAFAGIVVVAIAGNAVENVVGIQLAAKNKPDYAMSTILNSSLQISIGLIPVLVLVSFFLGGPVLTLVLPPLLIAALLLTTLTTATIVNDGETIWLEGVALIGLYGIIAAAFWWG
jgi:Ca2+:H+ antiporter